MQVNVEIEKNGHYYGITVVDEVHIDLGTIDSVIYECNRRTDAKCLSQFLPIFTKINQHEELHALCWDEVSLWTHDVDEDWLSMLRKDFAERMIRKIVKRL